MDFVTHLPRTPWRHDVVWVIVDRLTKSAHFLAVRMTFILEEFCRLYIRDIVQLHGVPVSIVWDRDSRFTTHFWKSFQKAMGTRLTMSTVFHPQTDGLKGPNPSFLFLTRGTLPALLQIRKKKPFISFKPFKK